MAPKPGQHEDLALKNLGNLLLGKGPVNDDWRKLCLTENGRDVGASPNHYILAVAVACWIRLVKGACDLFEPALAGLRRVMAQRNDHNQQEGQTDDGHFHLWLVGAILVREALRRLNSHDDLRKWLGARIRQSVAQQWLASNDPDRPESHVCIPAGQRWRGPKDGAWWPEWYILAGLGRSAPGKFARESAYNQEPFTVAGMFERCPMALAEFRDDVLTVYESFKVRRWLGLAEHVTEGTRAALHWLRFERGYVCCQEEQRGIPPTRYGVVCETGKAARQFPPIDTPVQKSRDGYGRLDINRMEIVCHDALDQIKDGDGDPMGLKPISAVLPFGHLGKLEFYMITSPTGREIRVGDDGEDTLDPSPMTPPDPVLPKVALGGGAGAGGCGALPADGGSEAWLLALGAFAVALLGAWLVDRWRARRHRLGVFEAAYRDAE